MLVNRSQQLVIWGYEVTRSKIFAELAIVGENLTPFQNLTDTSSGNMYRVRIPDAMCDRDIPFAAENIILSIV
jgi:hypothetical protein